MEMDYRCLDLTVVSAEGLKDVNMFLKMDVYVVVQILGYGIGKNKKRTHIDRNGGTNPRWNHRIKFNIDEPSLNNNPQLALLFQLKSERTFGGDRDIGEVTIPMQEIYNNGAGDDGNDSERVVEYQVRTTSGKAKGTLKFSYKFGEKVKKQPEAKTKAGSNEAVTAFPPPASAPQPAGASMAYASYPGMGYAAYQQPYPGYGGYPAPQGYPAGYPPSASGYGYPAPPQGYGYGQPMQQVQQPKKKKGMGAGLGLGLGAGLLGGLLVGDMVSDVGEMDAYADGYGDAMDDVSGGFDF